MKMLLRVAWVLVSSTVVLFVAYRWLNGWLSPDAEYSRTAHAITAVAAGSAVTGIVLLTVRFLDCRPASHIGASPFTGRSFALGYAAWLLPAMATLGALAALGTTKFTLHVPLPQLLLTILLQMALVFALEALPEELAFRGYIQTNLAERLDTAQAIGVQAILFMTAALALRGYNGPAESLRFLAVGLALGYIRSITGTIWTGVGLHVSFQTVAQLLLSPEQGSSISFTPGGFLPETIALGIIPFTAAIIIIGSTHPRPTTTRATPAAD
ncbi:lysostaphin resistance A-like protein [Kribbella sp. CA-294648]|uniref:CPBP family intramembrane glutamic endopeptidase n=1 Tax=Kribbella sp. CA-294648 TaxID=3239948 RepID=UPI003D89E246